MVEKITQEEVNILKYSNLELENRKLQLKLDQFRLNESQMKLDRLVSGMIKKYGFEPESKIELPRGIIKGKKIKTVKDK